jgi:hypothetical protein
MEKHIHIPLKKVNGHITWFGSNPPSKKFIDAINRMAESIVNLPEPELVKLSERVRFITECQETDPRQIRRKMLKEIGVALPLEEIRRIRGMEPGSSIFNEPIITGNYEQD